MGTAKDRLIEAMSDQVLPDMPDSDENRTLAHLHAYKRYAKQWGFVSAVTDLCLCAEKLFNLSPDDVKRQLEMGYNQYVDERSES